MFCNEICACVCVLHPIVRKNKHYNRGVQETGFEGSGTRGREQTEFVRRTRVRFAGLRERFSSKVERVRVVA